MALVRPVSIDTFMLTVMVFSRTFIDVIAAVRPLKSWITYASSRLITLTLCFNTRWVAANAYTTLVISWIYTISRMAAALVRSVRVVTALLAVMQAERAFIYIFTTISPFKTCITNAMSI